MTAKEWEESISKGLSLGHLEIDLPLILSDLAAAEAERDRLREELEDYKAYYEAAKSWWVPVKMTKIVESIEARRAGKPS